MDETTAAGFYTRFESLVACLTNVIKARIPFTVCVQISVRSNNLEKILQCKQLFQRIKDELFEPMLPQVLIIDFIDKPDENGTHTKKQFFKPESVPRRYPKSPNINHAPSYSLNFDMSIHSGQHVAELTMHIVH